MTAISLAPGLTEVTVFGGSTSVYDHDTMALTTIMTFGELNPCLHREGACDLYIIMIILL